MSDLTVIDKALQDLDWVRQAPARYASVMRELQELRAAGEPQLSSESMPFVLQVRELEREVDRLRPVVGDLPQFEAAALRALRLANGVETVGVMTKELGAIVLQRLRQGYRGRQVADMVGCAVSTVSNIKAGRYRFSELAPDAKHGARGHSRPR